VVDELEIFREATELCVLDKLREIDVEVGEGVLVPKVDGGVGLVPKEDGEGVLVLKVDGEVDLVLKVDGEFDLVLKVDGEVDFDGGAAALDAGGIGSGHSAKASRTPVTALLLLRTKVTVYVPAASPRRLPE